MATARIDLVEDLGNSKLIVGTFVGPASYATGGETLTIADTAQHDVTIERLAHVSGNGGGYVLEWDKANQKAIVRYGDYDAAADGALIQVPNTTNLSGVTFNFVAVGQ